MSIVTRSVTGKLTFNHLNMLSLFDEMFQECKTEEDVEWLQEQLQSYLDRSADETSDRIQEGQNG